MKIRFFSFVLLFVMIGVAAAVSQPMEFERAKQRVITMKKIKVLELLNLSEEKSDAFLSRYNNSENKIFSISRNIDNATRELHQLLENKTVKSSDLKQKSDEITKLQKDLHSAIEEKFNSFKAILNEEEFAKYLVFEHQFNEQIRKHMSRPRRGANPDDDEPPMQRGGGRRNR